MTDEISGYRRAGTLNAQEAAEVDRRMAMLDECIDNLVECYRDYRAAASPQAVFGGTCPIEIAEFLDSVEPGQVVAMLVNALNRLAQLPPEKDAS